jgi:hypothetical protein
MLRQSQVVSLFFKYTRFEIKDFYVYPYKIGRDAQRKITIKFSHIIQIVLQIFRIAEIKYESFCWLCQSDVHHCNLHSGNNVLQLVMELKQNRAFLLLFRR